MKNLLSYYNNLSEPIKATLWFTISSIIQKGIALLSTPIFTRLLTTEEYGVYSVYQSWYSILLIFATLNLYAGVYNNGMTKWPDKRQEYTSSLLGLSTCITLIWFIIYLVNRQFWNDLLGLSSIFMSAMFIQVLVEPAYSFWSASERFDYRYKKLVLISLIIGMISPILGVVAVVSTEYKAEARVLSYVLVQVLIGLVFYIYNMYKGKRFYIKKYWKFALSFNIPLIPHYLSQTILNQADRIMIASMVGKSEAAIYSVAYTISMMFTIVTNAINNSFIPYTYKSIRDKEYHQLKSSASFLVILVGTFCIIAMAFGPEIIRIFAASEYYEARWMIPPVSESLFFMFIYPLFCNIEFYYEQTKFIMLASGIAAIANIGMNYIVINQFGYISAAYTTLICYILLAVVHYFAYKIICKKNTINFEMYDINLIIRFSIISISIMVFMTLIYDYILIRYTIIIIILYIILKKRKLVKKKLMEIRN